MESRTPKVSIGLPIYNGENYLEEAVDSILAQTFTDFELIITDNASTDRTESLCRAYAARDPRVRYYRNETNLGAAPNYNLAFQLARGEYFRWQAHDDRLAPTYLEQCVAVLDREPEVILAYPKTILIDEHGQETEPYDDQYILRQPEPYARFKGYFFSSWLCNPIFGLMRREVLGRSALIGSYRASDRVLLGELAILGQAEEVPERLFYKRMHPRMSTQANLTDSELAAWFNPKKGGKTLYWVRWRWVREYFAAIHRARLTPYEALRCDLIVIRYVIISREWTRLELRLLREWLRNKLAGLRGAGQGPEQSPRAG